MTYASRSLFICVSSASFLLCRSQLCLRSKTSSVWRGRLTGNLFALHETDIARFGKWNSAGLRERTSSILHCSPLLGGQICLLVEFSIIASRGIIQRRERSIYITARSEIIMNNAIKYFNQKIGCSRKCDCFPFILTPFHCINA